MNPLVTTLLIHLRDLLRRDWGADLVEYTLVMGLIACGTISGMGNIATSIDSVFSIVATTINQDI